MSNQLLVNALPVTALAPLGSLIIPHGLVAAGVGVVPTQVVCDRASPLIVSNANTTNITVINPSASAQTANFRAEFDHSIHATGATPIRWRGVVGAGAAFASVYGSFSDDTDQPLTAGVATTVQFNTVEEAGGVTVANDGLGRPTRLTVPVTGVYQFDISPQVLHTGGGGIVLTFWALVDGVAVPRSASSLEMGNNNNRTLPFLSLILSLTAGQYVEWAFLSTGTNTSLEHFAAAPPIPDIPSVIANVLRIA